MPIGTIILKQTDTAAGCGVVSGCSGAGLANRVAGREATAGGTFGTSTAQIRLIGSAGGDQAGVVFQSAAGEPGLTLWPAGNWTVHLNVTTANANITWVATYVCLFRATCVSLATVGSLTGQSTSLGTIGVKGHTLSGSAQLAAASDVVYIVLVFSNGHALSQSFWFRPDQSIATPLREIIAPQRRRIEGN